MKTMTSKEAQNSFGLFLDTVQREPVMVTRRSRPVGVMLPMDNMEALFDAVDSMRQTIKQGVETGLAEAKAGLANELTDDYVNQLQNKLQARLDAKQS